MNKIIEYVDVTDIENFAKDLLAAARNSSSSLARNMSVKDIVEIVKRCELESVRCKNYVQRIKTKNY